MGTKIRRRLAPAVVALAAVAAACHRERPAAAGPVTTPKFPDPSEKDKPRAVPVRDEVPAGELDAVMAAHLEGLGHMERYEYDRAARAFREVHERAPGWVAGSINLAIALLNQAGTAEQPANAGVGGSHFEHALALLDEVIGRDPDNLHAHFCRGIILEALGHLERAHRDFRFVAEHDPADAHAWYRVGSTLVDPAHPDRPAGPEQAAQLIATYSRALERNPDLVGALYKLQAAYGWAGDRDRQQEVLRRWQRLNPASNPSGPGETVDSSYGAMGRYARIINPIPASRVVDVVPLWPQLAPYSPIAIEMPEGCRWSRPSDFDGPLAVVGRARARFGAAVASFDADGDGRLDLYLCGAVVDPNGVRDALLINRGDGRFDDATAGFGLPDDRASLGVAAGDFDADRRIDLFLTGVGSNRLLRNVGKRFEDVTERAGVAGQPAVSLTARWLDLDQDGDLDLYVVNHTFAGEADACFGEASVRGLRNAAYRNDGRPAPVSGRPADNWAPMAVAPADLPATAGLSIAFTPWPEADALLGDESPHTAVAALDLDDDRDLDLVLSADGRPPLAVLNDRLGRFHAAPMEVPEWPGRASGLLVTDLDKDGLADLVAITSEGRRVVALRNRGRESLRVSVAGTPGVAGVASRDPGAAGPGSRAATPATRAGSGPEPGLGRESARTSRGPSWESWPANVGRWACAVAADFDLDTWPDLVGLSRSRGEANVACARNEGWHLDEQMPWDREEGVTISGFALADLVGDPLLDLLIVPEGARPGLRGTGPSAADGWRSCRRGGGRPARTT